jgi:S1-C subfamily serine protease
MIMPRWLGLLAGFVLLAAALAPATAQDVPVDQTALEQQEETAEGEAASEQEPQGEPSELPATAPTTTPARSEADIAAAVSPSVVRVITDKGQGSGVKIDRGVLTVEHVIAGSSRIEIVAPNGARSSAVISRADSKSDLALLLTELPLPAVQVEPARTQRQGDPVLILGYPLGNQLQGPPTLSRGLISAIREIDGVLVVQTDATMNDGNSGGAMVNMAGKLIGVPAYGYARTTGLNFAIAGEVVEAFLTGPVVVAANPTRVPVPTPPVAGSGSASGSTRSRNPAAWSLRPTDMPPNFAQDDWTTEEKTGYATHAASFSQRSGSPQGAFVVANLVLSSTTGRPPSQSFMDEIADQTAQELTSSSTTASRATGPNLGDATRWLRATTSVSSRGVTVRAETHLVIFSVGNDIAVVLTMNLDGFGGGQGETVRYANVVLGRMRS